MRINLDDILEKVQIKIIKIRHGEDSSEKSFSGVLIQCLPEVYKDVLKDIKDTAEFYDIPVTIMPVTNRVVLDAGQRVDISNLAARIKYHFMTSGYKVEIREGKMTEV
jgi:hypothetical protein